MGARGGKEHRRSGPAAKQRLLWGRSYCHGAEVGWRERRARMRFTRITVDPEQMAGVPCIRGLRIPVATIVGMVADGMQAEEILRDFPDLEPEDIREALRYASEAVRERELPLRRAE